MTIDSRSILIAATGLMLFQKLVGSGLSSLLVLFSSVMGVLLCAYGLLLLVRETKANGLNSMRVVAGVFTLMLALQFSLSALAAGG